MVTSCVACKNRLKKGCGISFHRFPLQKPELLAKWVAAINKVHFEPSYHHVICSEHFTKKSYWKSNGKKILKYEAIPTIFTSRRKTQMASQKIVRRKHPVSDFQIGSLPSLNNDEALQEIRNELIGEPGTVECFEQSGNKTTEQEYLINKFKLIMSNLKAKRLVSTSLLKVVNNNFSDIMLGVILMTSEQNPEYTNILKRFALTVHFYSPAAYEHLRENVMSTLPPVDTVRKWHTSSTADPGFTEESFVVLEKQASSMSPNPVWVSLVFDEMLLETLIEWNGTSFAGYVNVGEDVCVSDMQEAKDALVLMVVAVNAAWRVPIAYYLVNNLSPDVKAHIVREAVLRLQQIKLNVLAVTCNGMSSNLAVAKKLGCNFTPEDLDSSFEVDGHNIPFLLDASCMIKLVRDLFYDLKIIKDQNDKVIDWKYIELLQHLQQSETKDNFLHFDHQKMKINAADAVSASVGKALLFVSNVVKHDQFQDAAPTAEFCLFFGKLIEIFNSKKGKTAVLTIRNNISSFKFLDYAESYLLGLTDQYNRPLYRTARKLAIVGLLSLCRGIKNIYAGVIETHKLKYLETYKYTLYHMECFFDNIQSRVGRHNPTALQFKAAYRHLLTGVDLD